MAKKLDPESIQTQLRDLPHWTLDNNQHLTRTISVDNFMTALQKANSIAPIAEACNHHPDLLVQWGKLSITLWTHDQGGLTQKDFDLATKINKIL